MGGGGYAAMGVGTASGLRCKRILTGATSGQISSLTKRSNGYGNAAW